jgi:hypothetical protein
MSESGGALKINEGLQNGLGLGIIIIIPLRLK